MRGNQNKDKIYFIDLSIFYDQPNSRVEHSALELARIITYYFNCGKILCAVSPDVGIYYFSDEFKEYVEKMEKNFDYDIEDASKEYMEKTGHTVAILFDGYEMVAIDIDLKEEYNVDIIRTFKSGNSIVLAVPFKEKTHVKRVKISDDIVLLDTLL